MGCDIHLHIEIKVDGKWEHYAAPDVPRWYELFEKMAGVRGKMSNAIIPPRGLPDDLNVVTQKSVDTRSTDGHMHSWFSQKEIALLQNWLGDSLEKDLEYSILHTYCEGNSFKKPSCNWIEDVRFVFWFDN